MAARISRCVLKQHQPVGAFLQHDFGFVQGAGVINLGLQFAAVLGKDFTNEKKILLLISYQQDAQHRRVNSELYGCGHLLKGVTAYIGISPLGGLALERQSAEEFAAEFGIGNRLRMELGKQGWNAGGPSGVFPLPDPLTNLGYSRLITQLWCPCGAVRKRKSCRILGTAHRFRAY